MPRIRKKTSRRQSTAQRAKITRKAGETRKKTKKAAKKDPQWKSKKKADPGIPNSFPYKDQILAEVAEERRQEEAAKIARKEAARSKAEDKEEDTPGIASLHSSSVYTSTAPSGAGSSYKAVEDEAPALVDTSLATLQDVLDRADVVLQVVDARDIAGRNVWIEGLVKDAGVYGLIINKADLVPREALESWLPLLPANTFVFSAPQTPPSASSSKPIVLGRSELVNHLKHLAESNIARDGNLRVALMGSPSVGKTSILNALVPSAPRHAVAPAIPPVSSAKAPGPTTKAPVEVSLALSDAISVQFIDTPGWDLVPDDLDEDDEEMNGSAVNEEKWDALEEVAVGDVLRRNLGRVDRIKDVLPLATNIVKRSNAQDLMLLYNIPFFQSGDVEAFLRALARANGRMKKGDQPDIEAGARILLRDWALSQFPYYSMPPSNIGASDDTNQATRLDLGSVLKACKGKKEMRATGRGLVRFQPGKIDQREIILDDDYTAAFEPSEDEGDDDDDKGMDDDDEEAEDAFEFDDAALEGMAEEEDVDGDVRIGSDEDDEEEEEVPLGKRKRGGATLKKKVSFGALPARESRRKMDQLVSKGPKGRKGGPRQSRG